jgi:hypothetical protein
MGQNPRHGLARNHRFLHDDAGPPRDREMVSTRARRGLRAVVPVCSPIRHHRSRQSRKNLINSIFHAGDAVFDAIMACLLISDCCRLPSSRIRDRSVASAHNFAQPDRRLPWQLAIMFSVGAITGPGAPPVSLHARGRNGAAVHRSGFDDRRN